MSKPTKPKQAQPEPKEAEATAPAAPVPAPNIVPLSGSSGGKGSAKQ